MQNHPCQKHTPVSHGETKAQEHTSSLVSEGKSEVAQLLRQIDREYEAAQRGLTGLAYGTAQHDFINARMERVAICHEQLATQVGEEEATRLIYDQYVQRIG